MKVLFDHQIFSIQKYGGVSKYFSKLIEHLPDNEWDLSLLYSNNEYIKHNPQIDYKNFIPKSKIIGKSTMMRVLNIPYSIFKINQGDFDVLHQTHYDTYCLPFLKNKPMVTTFHDMNFNRFNHSDLKIQKKSINKADKIIAVSRNTKNELIYSWNIPEEKIVVIYHGVDSPIDKSIIGKRLITEPYILYVGLRVDFKNFRRFAEAYSVVIEKYPKLKLICTGSNFTKEENVFFSELNILHNVKNVLASESVMANLYTFADFFIYPSLHEGFGMPILEAMSYGCPTVISNTSCFPEIAGDAAFYFDPYNKESIITVMLDLLADQSKLNSKKKLGYALCKKFTWEKCAEEHRKIYNSLL